MVSVDLIIVSSYVDYILVTDIDEKLITEFKVEMTDFGLLSFFLGMEVQQHKDGVLRQKEYAQKILKKF